VLFLGRMACNPGSADVGNVTVLASEIRLHASDVSCSSTTQPKMKAARRGKRVAFQACGPAPPGRDLLYARSSIATMRRTDLSTEEYGGIDGLR